MAHVTVDKGPITATSDVRDLPPDKWACLLDARSSFLRIHLPYDCRCLLDWVEDADRLEMWKVAGYSSLDDMIKRCWEIDPALVQWALTGLRSIKPDWAVPFDSAVSAGLLSVKRNAEEGPVMAGPGQSENSKAGVKANQGDNITLVPKRGTSQSYLAKRLRRDYPAIFAKLETYPSVRAAALEAGIVKPRIQIEPTVEGFLRAILRTLSIDQRHQLLASIKD